MALRWGSVDILGGVYCNKTTLAQSVDQVGFFDTYLTSSFNNADSSSLDNAALMLANSGEGEYEDGDGIMEVSIVYFIKNTKVA